MLNIRNSEEFFPQEETPPGRSAEDIAVPPSEAVSAESTQAETAELDTQEGEADSGSNSLVVEGEKAGGSRSSALSSPAKFR